MADTDPVLPSERELELETLLRQRDKQISSLTDEISSLRRKLPSAADPADDAAICVPPPVLALLAPLVAHGPSTSTSVPLNNVIVQRLTLLQTENDELYGLLRASESARAREEVVGLRKVIKRLEGSLADADTKISELTSKVDQARPSVKSLTAIQQQPRRSSTPDQRRSASPPRRSGPAQSRTRERSREHDRDREREKERDRERDRDRDRDRGGSSGGGAGLPTGPRSYKKPRLSAPNSTSESVPVRKPDGGGTGSRNGNDSSGGGGGGGGRNGNDRNPSSGRNGNGSGGGSRGGGPPNKGAGAGLPIRGSASTSGQNGQSGDRGLVQRLGL